MTASVIKILLNLDDWVHVPPSRIMPSTSTLLTAITAFSLTVNLERAQHPNVCPTLSPLLVKFKQFSIYGNNSC